MFWFVVVPCPITTGWYTSWSPKLGQMVIYPVSLVITPKLPDLVITRDDVLEGYSCFVYRTY